MLIKSTLKFVINQFQSNLRMNSEQTKNRKFSLETHPYFWFINTLKNQFWSYYYCYFKLFGILFEIKIKRITKTNVKKLVQFVYRCRYPLNSCNVSIVTIYFCLFQNVQTWTWSIKQNNLKVLNSYWLLCSTEFEQSFKIQFHQSLINYVSSEFFM